MRVMGGPLRIWLQDRFEPGLALSRSFGDKQAARIGVTSKPEIKRHPLERGDKFLIIGSDGLWDKLSNEQAVKTVSECYDRGDESMAASKLVSQASVRWINGSSHETCYMDDITALVVFFK